MPAKDSIRAWALEQGFDAVGFAPAALAPQAGERLAHFLAEGRHGDMGWLADRAAQRASPDALWPAARSVVVVASNYGPEDDPLAFLDQPQRGTLSVYARNRDYHDVMKKRLRRLATQIHQQLGTEVKLFVDTAPVMEKPLAQLAGLGWQGKHTNLVSRGFGSWLFLGSVFTALELAPDAAETDHCGGCSRCLDACPTQAFPAPYQLDARRCVAYLTIEHKGAIPAALRPGIGNRIYGCDDCLAVCPWNKFARATVDPGFLPRADLVAPLLAELAELDDAAFRARFSGSPVKRVGRDRFLRNVMIALGNGGPAGLPAVERGLGDPAPLVRAMAVWALARLDPAGFAARAGAALADEAEPEVRLEWEAAIPAA